jgi:VWFA-related protein
VATSEKLYEIPFRASAGRLAFCLALTTCTLFAQAAPPVLVRLHAVVTDGSGQAVTDMTADDFRVSDQNKAGRIVLFRHNDSATWTAAPQGKEYSNRPAAGPPHAAVILLDLMNQSQSDRLDAARTLGKSLQQLEAGDSVYLYLLTLEGKLEPVHPIGGKAEDDHKWTQDIEKTLDKAVKAASHARPAGVGQEDVVKKTYVALEAVGNQLAMLPGRRDIVWVTGMVPTVYPTNTTCSGDWVDCALYVPHLAVTLEKDSAAINPLSYSGSLNPTSTRDMEDLAGLTGGHAFFRDDVRAVLAQLGKDAANSYTIAYDPGADNWDNKFHKVRLTSERKGVKVQARTRYYAYPDTRPEAARQQASLVAAYQNPVDNPEIGLRMAITDAGAKGLHLAIRINAADLAFQEKGGYSDGAAVLLISDIGAAGPIGDPSLATFSFHLTKEQYAAAVKDGVPIAPDHQVKDGTQKLRIILLDQTTNWAGSLTAPIR